MDPLSAPGVAVDLDALLAARHLVSRQADGTSRATGLPGGFVSKRKGRGTETADIRAFAHGDDPRHIDRNATARTGTPHTRTFQDERDRIAILVADFNPAMHWGTRRAFRSVAAAEALALIGWRTVAAGGRVGLIAAGGPEPVFVPARGRERGMIAIAGSLSAAHRAALSSATARTDGPDLAATLDLARQVAPTGASVYLATSFDTPGDGFDTAALSLMHRADLTVLLIRDRFEIEAASGSYPFATGRGDWGIARIGTEGLGGRDGAREHLDRLGIPVLMLDAADDPAHTARSLEQLDVG